MAPVLDSKLVLVSFGCVRSYPRILLFKTASIYLARNSVSWLDKFSSLGLINWLVLSLLMYLWLDGGSDGGNDLGVVLPTF